MKKKMWLTLCNIGVSVVFLLSLYSYTKGMRLFRWDSNGTSYRNRYKRLIEQNLQQGGS